MDTKVTFAEGLVDNGIANGGPHDISIDKDISDEDDDAFADDPMSSEPFGSTKPLMHPRTRTRVTSRHPRCRCRYFIRPVFTLFLVLCTLGGISAVVVYILNGYYPDILAQFQGGTKETDDFIGCDTLDVSDVWVVPLPKLITESAFRLVDVNEDGVLDVIVGFGTGADGYNIPEVVCDIYFDGVTPCLGGVVALDGRTGTEIWRHWAEHELYGINCNADLNSDGIPDCLAGGRGAAFHAVNGRDGSLLWNFDKQEAKNPVMNMYTAHIVWDLDGDGVVDVLAVHGGDPLQGAGSKFRLSGRILMLSGKTGKVLNWVGVPEDKESYYSPQVYQLKEGVQMVLFGTGGETHGGALWRINLEDLYKGLIDKAVKIYEDDSKGVMAPPVLIDLTGDDVEDIVVPLFNSTVVAINGQTLKQIWNYTFPGSESYVTPSPGYYNHDEVPDFLVKYAHGPGYPIYYHSETTVLDGRTGQPLIHPFIRDTVGSQASGLTISMEGYGNDVFLYWLADCVGHEGQGGEFTFRNGTKVYAMSRANFCKLRFKTNGFSKVMAIGRSMRSPGKTVYNSEERKDVEHSGWINTTEEALHFLRNHPEYVEDKMEYDMRADGRHRPTTKPSPRQRAGEQMVNLPINQPPSFSAKKGPGMRKPATRRPKGDIYQDLYGDSAGPSAYKDNRYRGYPYSQSAYQDFNPYSSQSGFSPYDESASEDNNILQYLRQNLPRDYKDYPSNPLSATNPRSRPRPVSSVPGSYSKGGRTRSGFRRQSSLPIAMNKRRYKRKKRHIGPHDNSGLQRLISTGTLAPPTLSSDHPDFNNTIDFVFGVYWFFPVHAQAILPADQKCIATLMEKEDIRFDPHSKYHGMDHDAYEHAITDECLAKDNGDSSAYQRRSKYNPYDIKMGQMTVYRLRLTCKCNQTEVASGEKKCARILPFEQQEWPAYMGRNADSHWLPRT